MLMLEIVSTCASTSATRRWARWRMPGRRASTPAALAVPLAGMTGLTLGVTAPIDGPISPALTVNFDWGLLLPKR